MYPQLNFLDINVPLIKKGNTFFLADPVRKKEVVAQPEEWVRQHMIHFLKEKKGFPFSYMNLEFPLKYGKLNKRSDLLVYDKELRPILLSEFKSFNVKLSNETFLQAANYNHILKVPYLLISNGFNHHIAKINFETNAILFLDEIPNYSAL
ncbi:MAG: type I restriction enzyme HsdR N-terminal domain-containing protein [Bacteroidota bacterium]